MTEKDGDSAIRLERVTRKYGAVTALKDVSLAVPKGQLVGLLGRNGAGKTTALNLMTGYLPPTSGRILVNGRSMLEAPRECKRFIGYLPEQPPLYDEMTVTEYLMFVCELKEVVRRDRKRHTQEIEERCGLAEVGDRILGHLSKGYRQRAGIAQALCGNPDILILDEPTAGMDPRQTAETRGLIRELGKEHTVIFSSHLLPEVQQLCRRVIILHEGEVAGDLLLSGNAGSVRALLIRTAGSAGKAAEAVRTVPGVLEAETFTAEQASESGLRIRLAEGADGDAVRDAIFRRLAAADLPIREMREEREPLEELFLKLTE